MLPDELPDKIHVEFIRRALFRPLSRASVMVGAGFSRNADKISSAVPDFPLWRDITSALHDELYPGKELGFGVEVPRLGQEYAETYGRTALDDLIVRIIPDGKYEPGEMHRLLLELPWADVFTTNYDTLLERTCAKVYEIKYDVVLTPEDIARAERPRIVKLHGSFPSQRPFLFTAEDYRRYPIEQAPFVNMVQQSIMENALCLIGFSGDDPNFVQWIGWVRDQLGPAAPRLYLCGVFDLNASRRRYYESIRVIPVDLGPLFPESLFGSARHQVATRWLLSSLQNGKPADRSEWPTMLPRQATAPSQAEELLPLAPPSGPILLEAPRCEGKEADVETLRKLVQSWRSHREAYPGWLLCPEPNRQSLWQGDTSQWIHDGPTDPIRAALAALNPAERPEALHEIVWRLRRCRMPLTPALAASIAELFEGSALPPALAGRYEPMAKPPEGWETLTARLVELGFAMVNDAWQEQNEKQHKLWIERLHKVVMLKPEWRARWHFAQCWHHLLRLDEDAVAAALKEWPENAGLPFWEAKRAAVLAEIGDLDAAIRVAEAALARARQGADPARPDYRALSEEGCLVELLRVLPHGRGALQFNPHRDSMHVNRLRALRLERCDPTETLKEQERDLQQPKPGTSQKKTPGFDPGITVTSVHYRTSELSEWSLIQGIHDGPWPLPLAPVSSESVAECVRRIWPKSRRLAIALAIRGGIAKELEEMLSRVEVARIDAASADSLYDWLVRALRSAMKVPSTTADTGMVVRSLRTRIIDGSPRILSRLSVRLSPERLQDAFDLAITMYESAVFHHDFGHCDHVRSMFDRVLTAASMDQTWAWLPRLIKLPIPDLEDFAVAHTQWWPEPMGRLMSMLARPAGPAPTQDANAITRLVRAVNDGPREVRRRASMRLTSLVWARALTNGQMKAYVGALWSKTDAAGFPEDPGFAPWFLLELNERKEGEARDAVARFFLKSKIDATVDYLPWLCQSVAKRLEDDEGQSVVIEWTSAEAEVLLDKISGWWRSKRDFARQSDAVTINRPEAVRRPKRKRDEIWLVAVIADVLIPPIAGSGSEASRVDVQKLLSDVEQSGVSVLRALPALLLLDLDGKEDTGRRIRAALHGPTEDDAIDGCEALFSWLTLASGKHIEPPPPYLLNELVGNVLTRRQPGLHSTLWMAYTIIRRLPETIEAHHTDGLSRALGFLLHETDAAQNLEEDDELPLTSEQRVHLRGEASQLAAHLARHYHTRRLPPPPEVEAWRTIGAADPLPEVRRAWADVPRESESAATAGSNPTPDPGPGSGV